MNFFIVLFFLSLLGIIFMVGKKLRLILNGQMPSVEQVLLEVPRFEELEKSSGKMMRRLGYFLLVETIRAYVRLIQFLKNTYEKAEKKLAERLNKNGAVPPTPKEPNRFLKTVALYKRKIGEIKDEIKEEENL